MLLKTLAVLLHLERSALVLGAGLAERVGLLPALMVKMASHVNARYASYMVLFIAFLATFLPMRR